MAAALFAFFRYTLTGKAIRACADNHLGARVVGLNVKHLYALTFGLGSACVAVAGCMMILLLDVTPPRARLHAARVRDRHRRRPGLDDRRAARRRADRRVGGAAGLLFTPSAKSMFSFALLILVLLFRPQGCSARKP